MNRVRVFRLTHVLLICILCFACGTGGKSSGDVAKQAPGGDPTPAVDVAKVTEQKLAITVRLPGELQPYEVVAIYPKVTGFVKWLGVDRGSHVRSGELIARLEAPELVAQRAEAQAKLQSAQSQLAAAEAKLAADESTYQRLKAASATPGVVAGNDLVVAQQAAEADRAQVKAQQENVAAARQALQSVTEMEGYLQVKAPFDGVVTERNVHPGALVGPEGGPNASVPMVRIQTLARLRLVVPVPQTYVAGVPNGQKVDFNVPAFPGQAFTGTIARISHAVDVKTRTMPVELDVMNSGGRLEPGTFCEVLWPVRRSYPTQFVPTSSVVSTLQRVFVVRVRDNKAEWIDVRTGATSGNLIEVFGNLHTGDLVATRGTDELKPGTLVSPRSSGT